jgi:hypothetical protein
MHMNVEIGTEARRKTYSGNICLEFSVLYLYSAYLIGQREQTKHIQQKPITLKHIVTRLQNISAPSAPTPLLMKPTLLQHHY